MAAVGRQRARSGRQRRSGRPGRAERGAGRAGDPPCEAAQRFRGSPCRGRRGGGGCAAASSSEHEQPAELSAQDGAGFAGGADAQPQRRESREREQQPAEEVRDRSLAGDQRSRGRAVVDQQRADREDRAPRQRQHESASAALAHARAITIPPSVGTRAIISGPIA